MKVISKHFKEDRGFRKGISTEGRAFQASGVGKRTRLAALVMAFVMLSPLSAFASSSTSATTSEKEVPVTSESQSSNSATMTTETQAVPVSGSETEYMDWGRSKGIEIAVANGKTVELNKVFEYKGHKIKLENAVWEEDSLLITFSTLDKDKENTISPSQFSLLNEEGVNISNGHGMENSGDGRGIINFHLEEKLVNGDKLYLNIYTIRPNIPDTDKPDYTYTMILDKSLATEGKKINIDRECKTEYGTLKLTAASNDDGRLAIDYTFDALPEVKTLISYDPKTMIHVHIFPEISIKDSKNLIRANGRSSEGNGETGKLLFERMPELNRPVKIFIQCSEKLVNWKLALTVNRTPSETISINKEFKSEDDIFKLKDLRLGAASTSLDFEFIPGKDSKVNRVEPEVIMNLRGKKIPGSANYGELKGKINFNYPLSKKDLDDATIYLYSVNKSVECNESIKVEFDKTPSYNLKIDGSDIVISNVVVKDGKSCFDIGTNDANRKFSDFEVGIQSEKNHLSWSSSSENDRDLNKSKKPIKKSFQVDGEHKSLEITVNTLTYTDIYKSEIKLK